MSDRPEIQNTWIGLIDLNIFYTDVAVFASYEDRVAGLRSLGFEVEDDHPRALATTFLTIKPSGQFALSLVVTPAANEGTWAHEAVHVADMLMDHLGIPTGFENTEVRAYLTGHVFNQLSDILRRHAKRQRKIERREAKAAAKARKIT